MYNEIRRIGELSQDGVFIYNLEASSFEYINDEFAAIFSINKEQLKKKPQLLFPLIRSEDSYYLLHQLEVLKKNKTISNTEFRISLDDGSLRHISCDAYLMDDSNILAGFLKNFTKEKEHEDYIVNYGAKKDTLLDMMTHNLSGPLYLSRNILDWVQSNYQDNASADISSKLKLIQDNTKHCLDIINDFLRQEHLESERIYVKKTRFDVIEHITAVLDKLIASNRDKQFRLITRLENLSICTDSVKFFQIIHNLVSNAIKFTPQHGKIDIIVEETTSTFIIRVSDNGIGIPEHLHKTLFEKRTPSGRNGLNNELSTGLGLSIVKALVDLLGGTVSFETEENNGSTFSIELPKD